MNTKRISTLNVLVIKCGPDDLPRVQFVCHELTHDGLADVATHEAPHQPQLPLLLLVLGLGLCVEQRDHAVQDHVLRHVLRPEHVHLQVGLGPDWRCQQNIA